MGGVILISDSADKSARFNYELQSAEIPLVFPSAMSSLVSWWPSKAEHGESSRMGAKMVMHGEFGSKHPVLLRNYVWSG